ncbi:MAG: electron transport complex subunit RsxC [Clostridiales bacterium]|nr:electron transport complex subunit RsxC [Clostridiales bacterium]
MNLKSFKKGIHTPHNKLTESRFLAEVPAPGTVYIPLSQHIGKPATAVVSIGDYVKAGSKIGAADGFVSADIFSSVSGAVKGIQKRKTVTGFCDHVVIENDGKNLEQTLPPVRDLTDKDALLKRIKEAGLVGMGGAGFPSHVKYAPKNKVDRFIINGAECEPYITCDYRLLRERTEEVLLGAQMLATVLGIDEFDIGIEDNKPLAIDAVYSVIENNGVKARVTMLKSKYPQGAEKQLIYAVTGRKVPCGGLPSDVGAVVGNVHTAYALYEAALLGRPLYKRAVTVSGDIKNQGNYFVRTGTLYGDLVDFCGGLSGDCAKIISGGPMMGIAIPDLDYSISKTSGSLLFLSEEDVNTSQPKPCINCGKCARACPMNLMPMYIDAYTLNGDYSTAKKYGALNCIECGCCAYTCPAKRTIVQSVKLCKRKIKELGL